jgi:hypothetical protein
VNEIGSESYFFAALSSTAPQKTKEKDEQAKRVEEKLKHFHLIESRDDGKNSSGIRKIIDAPHNN